MGDSENVLPSSKKRAAGREISKDDPGLDDDEDLSEMETGTFKKASDEVLATRRIVKVRRSQSTAAPNLPSSNPFAGIRLVPPSEPSPALQSGATVVVTSNENDIKSGACDVAKEEKDASNGKQLESSASESVVESAGDKASTVNKVTTDTVGS